MKVWIRLMIGSKKLISQLEVHAAPVSREDINQKVYEDEMKRSSSSTSNSQNLAFLSSKNTSSTIKVSTTSINFGVNTAEGTNSSCQVSSTPGADEVVCSFFAQQTTSPPLDNEDLQQIDQDDLEELDIRWQVAMLTVRVQRFIKKTGRNLDFKGKQPVTFDKSQVECYNCHRKGHFAKGCKSGWNQGKRSYGDNGRRNATTNEPSSQALVAQDSLGGYDWSNDFDELINYALMSISSSSSSSSSDNEVQNCSKQCLESFKTLQKNFDSEREKHSIAKLEIQGYGTQLDEMSNKSETDSEISMSVFEVRSSDEEITPTNNRFSKADGYHVVPPPITGNFLTPRADISFAGLDEYAIRKKIIESKTTELNIDTSKSKTSETIGKTNEVNIKKPKSAHESVVPKPKINRDKVIIEDWNSDDKDDVSEVNTVNPVKTNETQTVKTQVDKIGQISQKEGIGFKKIKACFVCKSTDHLIKDCDFYAKKSPEPKLKTMVNTGQRVVKPVWDNAKRVNHQKFSNKLKYPQARRTFVPSGVLTRTGLVNPVRPNGKRAVHTVSTARPISTARPVSTARPFAPKIAQTGSAIRPIYPRMDNVRPRASYSPIKRSYYTKPAFRPKNLKQDVKTSGVKNMTTAGTRAVVNTGKGKMDNEKDNDLKEGNPEICLQDHAVVDSGCSSHMTGNKAYLSDYEDYNRGFVAFGSDPKGGKITGKGKIKTANLDFDDVYFVDELKKSDEGYLLGYSTTSKAFRVYNKRTKRVEENMHIDFLEDQPNVAGSGLDWMFDLDFLTNTMNYILVSVENQVNVDGGTQEHYVAGSSEKDKEPTQEYILLLLHPHRPRISVEDVVQAAQEKPSKIFPKDNDV
ncbi:ribonuclease H-like domain-containing protein [Tanacetum coccineum]